MCAPPFTLRPLKSSRLWSGGRVVRGAWPCSQYVPPSLFRTTPLICMCACVCMHAALLLPGLRPASPPRHFEHTDGQMDGWTDGRTDGLLQLIRYPGLFCWLRVCSMYPTLGRAFISRSRPMYSVGRGIQRTPADNHRHPVCLRITKSTVIYPARRCSPVHVSHRTCSVLYVRTCAFLRCISPPCGSAFVGSTVYLYTRRCRYPIPVLGLGSTTSNLENSKSALYISDIS